MITITDKKTLSLLTNDPKEIRTLFYELRKKDAPRSNRPRQGRLLSIVRRAGRAGALLEYPGTARDIKKLLGLGLLEKLGDAVEIHEADESSESIVVYKLTALGCDVRRYDLAVRSIEKREDAALTELKAKGRRALHKIREEGELPTAPSVLEDLFYAGMLERVGRGGKSLSERRAKQLRHEPLDRDKLRPTARFRRCVNRVNKDGSYRRDMSFVA